MNRLRLVLILVLMVVMSAAGCKQPEQAWPEAKSQLNIYGFVASDGWTTRLFLNGQPILPLKGNITMWVVNGRNTIHLLADRKQRHSKSERFALTKSRPDSFAAYDTIWQLHETDLENKDHLDLTFTFDAEVPVRWGWEDGETLAPLTDADKKEFQAVFTRIAEAMKSGQLNWPEAFGPDAIYCGPGKTPDPDYVKLLHDTAKTVSKYDDLTVAVAPSDTLAFEQGSKIALLYSRTGNLIDAGHGPDHKAASGDMNRGLKLVVLGFVKIGGHWHVLWG